MNQAQIRQTEKAIDHLQRMINAGLDQKTDQSGCGVYHCQNNYYDKSTVEHIRANVKLYVESWILPRLNAVLEFGKSLTASELKAKIIFRTFEINGWRFWAESQTAIEKFANGRTIRSTDGVNIYRGQRYIKVAPGVYQVLDEKYLNSY